MLRILPESQCNMLGVELSKSITKKDYREILQPAFDRIIAEHGKVRVVFDFAEDFSGFEFQIILEDLRFVIKHLKQFERVALINNPKWLGPLLKLFEVITKCPCKIFASTEREQAWAFIEGVD